MQGADFVTLHLSPELLMFFVQHASAPPVLCEQPDPPHAPQLVGQHMSLASYPVTPLEHGLVDWAGKVLTRPRGGGEGGGLNERTS